MRAARSDPHWEMRTGLEQTEEGVLSVLARAPQAVVAVSRQVTRLGDRAPVWIAVAAAGVFRSARLHREDPLVAAVTTLAVGATVRAGLAISLNRQRPPERLWHMEWSGPSFPSRHTTLATLGADLVAGCLTADSPRTARVITWGTAGAVGVSRLVLGVHWPTDVLGGWLFAAGMLAVSHRARTAAGIARG